MKTSYIKYFYLVFFLTLFGCSNFFKNRDRVPIVKINGKILYKDELDKIMPENISELDSTNIADKFIKKWATTNLMYHTAKKNIINQEDIDKLVEKYRQSLTIHEYEQRLVSQYIDTNLTEIEIKEFYDKFSSKLSLDENIIKGMLLITPKQIPNINKVRIWIKTGKTQDIEEIEKYSLKNAVSFDYFMEEWKPFSEIIKKIPIKIEDSRSFLRNNQFVERSDSTKHYFLKISAIKLKGQIEPFETAKKKISYIVLNKKKRDFILNLETSIYKDAIKNGEIKFPTKKTKK